MIESSQQEDSECLKLCLKSDVPRQSQIKSQNRVLSLLAAETSVSTAALPSSLKMLQMCGEEIPRV